MRRVAVGVPEAEAAGLRHVGLAGGVQRVQQRGQQALHRAGVALFDELAVGALGDGVELALVSLTELQHARDAELGRRPALGELVFAKVLVGGAEARDQLSTVACREEVSARPLAVADALDGCRVDRAYLLREK